MRTLASTAARISPRPTLTRSLAGGVKFTSGYVAYAVCGPSRASFITGRYGQRFGFERNPQYQPGDPNMGVPIEETTIADALHEVGYHSGVIGKWHLGAHEAASPTQPRYSMSSTGILAAGTATFLKSSPSKRATKRRAKTKAIGLGSFAIANQSNRRKYLTDEFSDEAVSFVQSQP